jgi:putative transposase
MPRKPRICYPGAIYHVGTRGVDRQPIFLDVGDRMRFLSLLAAVTSRYCWRVHAYCLMKNHFHLVVDTPQANISPAMQYLNSRYVERFNEKYGREGHLVERRFWADLILTEARAVATSRYVVLNPVRAGICSHPAEWPWSSYRATVGLAPAPTFLTLEWTLGLFDGSRERYRRFVDEAVEAIAAAA